ncbi:MAG: ISNCY family transposase [Lysobacterales bacterium CG17_big_fil_post_rev_8_21_14_2_50_64_11]|nr:MAG: ISNCY family transposase [Xanthomonadales bacterium CG17_big_fil_post_rev_8_21_14_2_50_64_11]
MSQTEVKRAQVLDTLKEGEISQLEAARRIGVSTRQARRLAKRYLREGVAGLISKKRGRASNRRLDETLRATAIELIGAQYRDFGPTLACEKLAGSHGIRLSVESVRQMMMRAGYWKPKRGGTVCAHPMRERRARFGEMIQIDGSPHDWFEGRGERCTLLVFIDDATGKLTQLRFMPTETTLGYMSVLHDHVLAHGVPAALYSDKHSIFRINAKDADPEAETQFSRAARELGIECIHAHSPQAKGRVERANQTLQDRLVKEMRLAGINDMAAANAWLPGYIADYNRRFAVEPKDTSNAHLAYPDAPGTLLRILSVHVTKTLSKNLSCQHENKLLQVVTTGTGLGLRGAKVTLHEHFDGSHELIWKQRKLAYSVMDKPQRQSPLADGKSVNAHVDKAVARRNTGHKPAPNHPWRNTPVGKSAHDGLCATS